MRYTLTILSIIFLVSCNNGPTFTWNPEVKEIISGDLDNWLKAAPFEGLWDPNDNNEGKVYITNTREVYPFMGELINKNDNLLYSNEKYKPFHKEQFKVYKDDIWGESVVYAGLLYEPEELFMRKSYSKSANMLVDGMASMNSRNYASLEETVLYANTPSYKTAVYWVDGNNKTYLMGFYQKDQLAFQVAFPCSQNEKEKGIKQLQRIAQEMNLDIPAWKTATANDLEVDESGKSFWKDPYKSLFYTVSMMSPLKINVEETIFEGEEIEGDRMGTTGHSITHRKGNKTYTLDITKESTEMSQLQFHESEKSKILKGADNRERKYIFETTQEGGTTTKTAKTYYKDNTLFVITYTYPTGDEANSDVLDSILRITKINSYVL